LRAKKKGVGRETLNTHIFIFDLIIRDATVTVKCRTAIKTLFLYL